MRLLVSPGEKNQNNINSNEHPTPKHNINQKDIIDADFEEIKENKEKEKGN